MPPLSARDEFADRLLEPSDNFLLLCRAAALGLRRPG
jgi:hypothetical protein